MSKNTAIEIFLRVRPTKKPFAGMSVLPDQHKIEFHIPKDETQGYINNQREDYLFDFDNLFGMDTKQDQIFDNIAKEVVDSALDGYNGTIFAYGQTGSGKTYTMTGGAERYVDRGIIPRTLSYIFSETKRRSDTYYKISVSYLEIYNADGYDLLDENHTTKNLTDLPKVIPRETEDGRMILSGLSVHKAENEEQALNLLFIGDTNRVVSETPMNDASTRSHCIFIITMEATKAGSDVKTISRLHLVDLSGSERVGKTGVNGVLLKEAIYINTSLHYLEQVIICLNKKSKGENVFVPYRNSLMTMVLRDSLGGNCKTRMIATVSAEAPNLDESLSTCRFAQRVALIKNAVSRNEAVDPALIIERLKKENSELRAQLALLNGGSSKTSLDQDEVEECKHIVDDYIKNSDPGSKIILTDMIKINECFYHFKHIYNDLVRKYEKAGSSMATTKILKDGLGMNKEILGPDPNSEKLSDEVKKLKLLVQQRDNEIMILLNLINKNKGSEQSNLVPVDSNDKSMIISSNRDDLHKPITFPQFQNTLDLEKENKSNSTPKRLTYEDNKPMTVIQKTMPNRQTTGSYPSEPLKFNSEGTRTPSETDSTATKTSGGFQEPTIIKEVEEVNSMLINPLNLTTDQLMDRASTFELFRKSYRKNQALEENKELLKEKFAKGKELGQVVNNSRDMINKLKNQIEDLRKERALQGLLNNDKDVSKHPDEDRIANEIERQKRIYKEGFDELKDLKAEIERIQTLLERNHQRLQKDFDKWIEVMLTQRTVLTNTTKVGNTPSITSKANGYGVSSSNNNLDQSILSQTTTVSQNKTGDVSVQRNLASFYKARDEIYKNLNTSK